MKLNKFLFLASIAAVALVSCDGPVTPGPGPGPGPGPKGDDTIEVITIDTTKAISLDAAIALADQSIEVVIKGYVAYTFNTSVSSKTGKLQQTAWIAENATDKSGKIQAYWCDITDSVAKGDYVAVQGEVITYIKSANDTTFEIKNGIMQLIRKGDGIAPIIVEDLEGDGLTEKPYTVADVIALASSKEGPAYVKGIIVGQVKAGGMNMKSDLELAAPFTGNDSGQGTNIVIAAAAGESNAANMVPVQLPSGLRTFSLPADASMLGKEIIIYGKLQNYFGQPGVKEISFAKIGDKTYGAKPVAVTGDEKLNETLLTQTSFDKFIAVSDTGDLKWSFDSKYGAKMSGYDDVQKKTFANEDWFISPAFDATGGATLSFDHARGPKGSMSVSTDNYTVWVSNNFSGDVATATWTQIAIPTHGTTAWGYVNSGNMAIPAANCAANCRIAWKYVCDDNESATWEIKNVIVK